jgi:hypothetical protein
VSGWTFFSFLSFSCCYGSVKVPSQPPATV